MSGVTDQFIKGELNKAKGHIERIVLDCYKFLSVYLFDMTIKRFDRRTKNINLPAIDNGCFYIQYCDLRRNVELTLKKAKLEEARDKEEALILYQQAYNCYTDLEDLIQKNNVHIIWAKAKFTTNRALKFFGWLFSAIISGVISSQWVPWGDWLKILLSYFN